jgi:sulfite reductase (NADPH) hemoprotein beta-component
MYRYDALDQKLVDDRARQFAGQTQRFLTGQLTEDQFRPLRLQNGLYIQRHAPMLRIAIPYGQLASRQLRKLAEVATRYDRGYGHFTTRQNLQFNWIPLEQVPEVLGELATVQMHAIQTSGNCIRNVTSDHLAGVAEDEIVDPRPYCELIRQWSTLHPEFAYLPRKFKIAVSGSRDDRAAVQVHDIGLYVLKNGRGEVGFRVLVGGGLGRTAILGHVIRQWLPEADLLGYLEAILRTYNRFGRRDNKWKARIKILVKELTPAKFAQAVEDEFVHVAGTAPAVSAELARLAAHFAPPAYERHDAQTLARTRATLDAEAAASKPLARWLERNVGRHRQPGYAVVTLTLKRPGRSPGDVGATEMLAVADLADRYSFGELRVSHEQNLVLADVRRCDLPALFAQARAAGLAAPVHGLLTDLICCPGGDYCSLANARSIPIAQEIWARFDDLDYLHDLGEIDLNISGCMNSCGHHHLGDIGVLGVDKNGSEFYQVSIGGAQGNDARLGDVIGPSFAQSEVVDVVARLLDVYVERREGDERFVDTVRRLGITPFKERVYGNADASHPRVRRGHVAADRATQ